MCTLHAQVHGMHASQVWGCQACVDIVSCSLKCGMPETASHRRASRILKAADGSHPQLGHYQHQPLCQHLRLNCIAGMPWFGGVVLTAAMQLHSQGCAGEATRSHPALSKLLDGPPACR